jgi:hypothetical protein
VNNDITYCTHEFFEHKCGWYKCIFNQANITEHNVPISFADRYNERDCLLYQKRDEE